MVKLDIFPTFLAPCTLMLEQEDNGWLFSFNSKRAELLELVNVNNTSGIEEIIKLSEEVICALRIDNKNSRDGVMVIYTAQINGKEQSFQYYNPEPGTSELHLVNLWIQLYLDQIKTAQFVSYMEQVEHYFFENLPLRIFDEVPRRIRICNAEDTGLSSQLEVIIRKLSTDEELIADLTCCNNIISSTFPSFRPLLARQNVTLILSYAIHSYIERNGFYRFIARAGYPTPKIKIL